MIDEYRFLQNQRPSRRRLDINELLGWGICGIAITYLFAAALLGLLAS